MIKEKAKEVVEYYDILPQLKYLQSEVFELSEAIICAEQFKKFNDRYTIFDKGHIAEEIADVMFFLIQFMEYYEIDDERIEKVLNYKADRQLGRINNEKATKKQEKGE